MGEGMIFGQMEIGRSLFQGIVKSMNSWPATFFEGQGKEGSREVLGKGV
jgi:hypothetical protein